MCPSRQADPQSPMIDAELLDILVCPETKQAVRPADDTLLARVNDAIAAGAVRSRGGDTVSEPLHEALVREDGRVLYPVRDDIPVMLIDEAIDVPEPTPHAS
jgi:uncharacterized protein YbaR (Trm112 family)